jgi:uncharacterized membrane protein YvbJ
MPTVQCKECGEQFSAEAQACTHCGAELASKKSVYTWLIPLLIILVVGAPFFFVGSESSRTPEEKAALQEQVEAEYRRKGLEQTGDRNK